jgi:hypothetical protein
MTQHTRKLIRRIITAAIVTALALEGSNPLVAAEQLNAAWQLQVDAAGRCVELFCAATVAA